MEGFKRFLQKNNQINKKNIDKYFIKKNIFNLSSLNFNFTDNLNYARNENVDNYEILNLLKDYILFGVLFDKAKDFSLTLLGDITFGTDTCYYIVCFYSKTDKRHHLLLLFLEADGNDQYHYIQSFKTPPNLSQVKFAVDKSKSDLLYYNWNSKHVENFNIYKPKNKSTLSAWSLKENKKALKSERVENRIFKDEDSFYNHFKNDSIVQTNYLKKYPEKYFKNQNPIWLIN